MFWPPLVVASSGGRRVSHAGHGAEPPSTARRRRRGRGCRRPAGSPRARPLPRAARAADPFPLGVASGDPLPDSVMLWTRLLRPIGALPARPIAVGWQVAHDERFRRVVRAGRTLARPELGPLGARRRARACGPAASTSTGSGPSARSARSGGPGRRRPPWHDAGSAAVRRSSTARTSRTATGPRTTGLADEDLDVVVHLGDYIYEYDPNSRVPRPPPHHAGRRPASTSCARWTTTGPGTRSTSRDPALQAAHAAFPWIVTWDDHETENNYADAGRRDRRHRRAPADARAVRRAAGRRVPGVLRAHADPGRPAPGQRRTCASSAASTSAGWLRVNVLDTRQYRTDQPGGFPSDFGPAGGRRRPTRPAR